MLQYHLNLVMNMFRKCQYWICETVELLKLKPIFKLSTALYCVADFGSFCHLNELNKRHAHAHIGNHVYLLYICFKYKCLKHCAFTRKILMMKYQSNTWTISWNNVLFAIDVAFPLSFSFPYPSSNFYLFLRFIHLSKHFAQAFE